MIFYTLSREFGWTPDQIRRVTLQELEHYFAQGMTYRNAVPEPDVSLALICAFLGIKEPAGSTADRLDAELAKVKAPKVTQEESDAWLAAGMPSPMSAWLKAYRDERRRTGRQAEGGP